MTSGQDLNTDALVTAARDISKHIAGLADELLHLRHPVGDVSATIVHAQINKLKDQAALLTAVINDIAKSESVGV
jgi:hypothetical protein